MKHLENQPMDQREKLKEVFRNLPPMEKPDLPPRIFAVGHESIGVRVTTYHPAGGIRSILNALEQDEVEYLRNSSFGNFLTIADKPGYSERFGRFLISRQLKVKKKKEIWFLFAGRPIRFSLREFAIIIYFPCGKFPKRSKKKMEKNISETPYWPLFLGKLQSITVSSIIRMLKRNIVTDKETRIKYACLVLLAFVLLPTTHHPKIVKEHAELTKDLDEFFAYRGYVDNLHYNGKISTG